MNITNVPTNTPTVMKMLFIVIAFFTLNLSFAQYTVNNNKTTKWAFNTNLEVPDLNKSTAINFSDYYLNDTNTVSSMSLNSKKISLFELPNYVYPDSTIATQKWYKTDTGISLIVAGGLITTGTIMHFNRSFKTGVRDEINRYLPEFEDDIDDLTQYIPMAAMFALDAAGIRSKHNTTRKISTLATSIGLNLIVVQGLKYSIAEIRPDGSSKNAFPSGHTATAFMGAHMFHKEYKHKSPFYSIAGYALATFTGVLRQLNNRHWISDVTAGAGIGIAVTELAYFLNDGWWKEKGINDSETTERIINELKPSFLGAKVAYAALVNQIKGPESGLSYKSGFRMTAEGAYFLNKNFGIGGEIGFQSFPMEIAPDIQSKFYDAGFEVLPETAGNRMYYGGAYYQIPFGKNSIGTKLHAGVISGPNTKIYARELGRDVFDQDTEPLQYIYADFDPETSFSWATGIYYKRMISKNLSLGIYADYNWADLKYDVTVMDDFNNGFPTYFPKEKTTTNYDSYAIGVNINVMLW